MSQCIVKDCNGEILQREDKDTGESYYECKSCGYKRYPNKKSSEGKIRKRNKK